MGQKLHEFFEKKFDENFRGVAPKVAFEKTIEQIGFDAYASYESFDSARRRKKKDRR